MLTRMISLNYQTTCILIQVIINCFNWIDIRTTGSGEYPEIVESGSIMTSRNAVLYIVATPIGNLADITQRAISILKTVDVIAAEDTRHTGLLLKHLNIKNKMLSLHEHNERSQSSIIIQRLEHGESVALVSDAGTPLISDPGFFLVREVRQVGFKVVPIPGPCAMITALSVSGIATDRFVF